ncbi:MAG: NAD-dependent deacetylase [Lysobacterales bacterium]
MPEPLPDDARDERVARAARLIRAADALVIAAGAGIGVDSGLPDFRGGQGFWTAYPALGRAGIGFTEIANPRAFAESAELAWGFYGHRLALYRHTTPHAGFRLLRHWGSRMAQGCGVFTSNVDGQFQRAGFDPARIHECHGSIHHLQCTALCSGAVWPAEGFVPEIDETRCVLDNAAPTCPRCGALARPNILMFDDYDWVERPSSLQSMRLEGWLHGLVRPLLIEIGAGTAIPSVRDFSRRLQAGRGARLIRINPDDATVASDQDVALPLAALPALRAIADALGADWQTR